MEPICLFSLEVMKCVNDRNTHPDFKHVMRFMSEKYIKHLVAVSKKRWALQTVPEKLKTKVMCCVAINRDCFAL